MSTLFKTSNLEEATRDSRRRRVFGSLATVALVLLVSPAEAAVLTYLSQTRSVWANSAVDGGNESFSATDFGEFSESVSVLGASATQSSTLGDTMIDLSTQVGGYEAAISESEFYVSFSINEPVAYSLVGTANPDRFNNHATITLRELGGSILYESDPSWPGPHPISSEGVLAAGSYELFTNLAYAYPVSFSGEDIQAVLTISAMEAVPSMSPSSLGVMAMLLAGLGMMSLNIRAARTA